MKKKKKTHASVTVSVVRDRKIRTALRTNQIVGFVTVPAWKKIRSLMSGFHFDIEKSLVLHPFDKRPALKASRHFFIQSKVKPKPIVTRSCTSSSSRPPTSYFPCLKPTYLSCQVVTTVTSSSSLSSLGV